jgi:pimeloyl-ACP methyl ester carboxylesterase
VARLVREGVALAYDEAGIGDPPLLFVHGLGCNRGFWGAQVRHFASRCRVLTVDLRGHGDSDAPEQRYTMRAFADDLAWMCARLGVVRPMVIGHSLGGLVALDLAAAEPRSASDQALRTPPHVLSSVWEESIRAWDDADALRRCRVPLAYLDAGTPNADLARASELSPQLMIGRTVGSGHFSPLEVPDQITAMLERLLARL